MDWSRRHSFGGLDGESGFKLTMKPRFVKELAEAEEYATRARLESGSTPIEKGMGCGQTEVPCTPACGTAKGRTTLNGVIGEGFPGIFKTVTLCPVEVACLQLPSAFNVVVCVPRLMDSPVGTLIGADAVLVTCPKEVSEPFPMLKNSMAFEPVSATARTPRVGSISMALGFNPAGNGGVDLVGAPLE